MKTLSKLIRDENIRLSHVMNFNNSVNSSCLWNCRSFSVTSITSVVLSLVQLLPGSSEFNVLSILANQHIYGD